MKKKRTIEDTDSMIRSWGRSAISEGREAISFSWQKKDVRALSSPIMGFRVLSLALPRFRYVMSDNTDVGGDTRIGASSIPNSLPSCSMSFTEERSLEGGRRERKQNRGMNLEPEFSVGGPQGVSLAPCQSFPGRRAGTARAYPP